VLVGAFGDASNAVGGVVSVIRLVQGVLLLPEELTHASTELASVLMSACGTTAEELFGRAE
jgi:hypothetical protein